MVLIYFKYINKMSEKESKLRELYYDPSTGLLSRVKLYQKARSNGIDVTIEDVNNFINSQELDQVFNRRRVKTHFALQANYPFQRIQIDLMDMSNQAIRGYKWIFCLIDVYTRYAICEPLKSKSETECVRAFEQSLEKIREISDNEIQQLDSDKESAFLSRSFQKVVSDYGIEHRTSEINDVKSKAVVERFNRTLRGYINKYIVAFRDRDWVTPFQRLIYNYNNTINKGIKTTPIKALIDNTTYDDLRRKQNAKARTQTYLRDDINIGDTVRLKIRKTIFDKEGHPWTRTTHKVERIESGMYYVSDRVNGYKRYELLLVNSIQRASSDDSVSNKQIEADISVENEERQKRRTNRRIRKEGIDTSNIEQDSTSRELRKYRKPRDTGFNITDYDF